MKISEIKSQLSMERVLNHYGLIANRNGMLCCPFHEDKTPSFQVYAKTNSYCCFSTNCEVGSGDQLELIGLMEEKLGRVSGTSKEVKHHAIQVAKRLLGCIDEVEVKRTSLETTFVSLIQNLAGSKKAQGYAKSRHIDLSKTELGYNSGSFGELRYCLVFPLKNEQGQIVSLYGRSIVGNSKTRHFYQSGRRGLYPGYPSKSTKRLILTESIIDALSLAQHMEPSAGDSILALYGTNGLTSEHEKAIASLSALKEVILFFDGDASGREAVKKWHKHLSDLRSDVLISSVSTPEGEDINSLLDGHEEGVLTHLLESRQLLNTQKSKPTVSPKGKLDISNPNLLSYQRGCLLFTLLGGIKLSQLDRLRVTLKVERYPKSHYLQSLRHSFDLYNADQLERYARKASDQLDVGSVELRSALYELIDLLEDYRHAGDHGVLRAKRVLSEARRQRALNYLSSTELMSRTNRDIGRTGVVGEEINRLLVYICYTSRLCKHPLHVVTLGGSGTGKTYLQEKIGALIPEEDVVQCTSSSDNALYYIKNGDLRNKLVLIEDLDGVDSSMYILRELMSKQVVSKLVVQKEASGTMETTRMTVYGPISLSATTTRERLYEDNSNRSLLISPDSSMSHRDSIMDQQRKLSAGLINEENQEQLRELFKDIQSVLEPTQVRNPYAEDLRIPKECFKPLRTHAHYLHFIEAVTFYHQHQREQKVDAQSGDTYIETSIEDIAWANDLLKEVLLRKSDELSGACRRFYERLKAWLQREGKTQVISRELIRVFRMAPRTVGRHLQSLKSYGYLKEVGGNRYREGIKYELVEVRSYGELKQGVSTILDEVLKELSAKKESASQPESAKKEVA